MIVHLQIIKVYYICNYDYLYRDIRENIIILNGELCKVWWATVFCSVFTSIWDVSEAVFIEKILEKKD